MTRIKPTSQSVEMGDQFTPDGLARLTVGQILKFNFEGSIVSYRITRLNRKSHKLWATPVQMWKDEETRVQVVDKKDAA